MPLDDSEYDLLIIGGGIVGSGVARDAAMRGLKVLLVEQHDFAFGTSGRSSKLLHGGLRYLAQMRIGLVREASREKTILHRIAPHLAMPLAFIFPTYRRSAWSRWKLRIGVTVYDWLCGGGNLGKSKTLSSKQTSELLPGLDPNRLTGAVRYFDGFTNDARLVIDTLQAAEQNNATLRNYCKFVDAKQNGDVWECKLHDLISDLPITIKTKAIVNATGPWSDQIPQSKTHLRPTKGAHLVIERSRLPVPDAVVVVDANRILFAIPWGERVILGTTDTDYDGPLDSIYCETEDAEYILRIMNGAFPNAKLNQSDIVSTWAGLRPLLYQPGKHPSDISRKHEIKSSVKGWIDVTGGKLTTYRLIAEQVVDQVIRQFPGSYKDCTTATVPILSDENHGASAVIPPEVSEQVVKKICEKEWVIHLSDLMIRRTSWLYYHQNHLKIAKDVVHWMADSFNWDASKIELELSSYKEKTDGNAVYKG